MISCCRGVDRFDFIDVSDFLHVVPGGIRKGFSFQASPTQRRMRLASVVAGLGMA